MSKKKIVLITLVVVLIGVVLGGYNILTSLWFLKSLVSENSQIVVVADLRNSTVLSLLPQLKHVGVKNLNTELSNTGVTKIALGQTNNEELKLGILVKYPWVAKEVSGKLESSGWETKTYGGIILANSTHKIINPSAKSQLSRTFNELGKTVKMGNLFNEVLELSIKKGVADWVSSDIDLFAYERDTSLVIDAFYGGEKGDIVNSIRDKNISDKEVKIAISSKMLSLIPLSLKQEIIPVFANNLGIIHKRKDLNSLLGNFNYLEIISQGDKDLGILFSEKDAYNSLKDLVESEEAYYHPQRKAFRLPDGTIGFELNPGSFEVRWSKVNNCEYLSGLNNTWWVCGNEKGASLSTSQQTGEKLITGDINEGKWSIELGKKFTEKNIQKSIISGGDSNATRIIIK